MEIEDVYAAVREVDGELLGSLYNVICSRVVGALELCRVEAGHRHREPKLVGVLGELPAEFHAELLLDVEELVHVERVDPHRHAAVPPTLHRCCAHSHAQEAARPHNVPSAQPRHHHFLLCDHDGALLNVEHVVTLGVLLDDRHAVAREGLPVRVAEEEVPLVLIQRHGPSEYPIATVCTGGRREEVVDAVVLRDERAEDVAEGLRVLEENGRLRVG
mmetsp:Transcript_4229/g.14912  ORF Transcript_4229/g.14912 Transcript_4229/m.14912 type:complete len:217 (-) Transcript_4229:743-1393(-)